MLKHILITPEMDEKELKTEAVESIEVYTPAVITEAEEKFSKGGAPSYMDRFMAGKTKLRKRHGWWPEEKKIEAVALYAAGMVSDDEISRLTKIPSDTIKDWKTQEWWLELLEKVHTTIDQDIVSKQTKIVDKALEAIQDRLIDGEYIVKSRKQADGTFKDEVVRRPVSMRDANIVATTIIDKRQLLRGKATSRSEKIGVDDRLAKLAEEFRKFTNMRDITEEAQKLNMENS